ncbi:MAG: hypothetical protein M3Q58_10715 [Bacteroidota bacterium]|nr:hypothetical protein [Bacteroidota bacterium]
MKTTNITLKKKVIVLTTLCLILIQTGKTTAAGKPYFGAGIYSSVSGNGFGLTYSPGFTISSYKNSITLGCIINKSGINGINGVYNYILNQSENNFKIYLHNSSSYHHAGILNPHIHSLIDAPGDEFVKQNRANKYVVIENYTGFGISKTLFSSLSIDFNFGAGGYCTLNKNDISHSNKNYLPIRADNDFSTNARLGLVYDF